MKKERLTPMDMKEAFEQMRGLAIEEAKRREDTVEEECGLANLGSWVARLQRHFPPSDIVANGLCSPSLMDGQGAKPVLMIYRLKGKVLQIGGRESLDNLADLLNGAGFGKAGRAQT